MDAKSFVRVGRIVSGAMLGGVATFAVVAIVLVANGFRPADGVPANVLLLVLGALLPAEIMGYVIVRQAIQGRIRASAERNPKLTLDDVARQWFPVVIVGGALADAYGLFGSVVYLLTGQALALLAAVVAIALLLLNMPSMEKLKAVAQAATGRIFE